MMMILNILVCDENFSLIINYGFFIVFRRQCNDNNMDNYNVYGSILCPFPYSNLDY